MLTAPQSPAAEAFRTLRVNVQFAGIDRDIRTIAVTSPSAGDGKTTTLANLAVALAEGGARVLAVDADLRRPGLHAAFGLDNGAGLTSALLQNLEALHLQDTAVPGLRVLASGPLPPNPVELLASRRFDRLLAVLREQADYVLLDSPPAAALSDAPLLAARADGVILVVGAGRTKRDAARRAKDQLQRVNAHVLGVVLSGVRADASLYAY
jgi:non-specific protein-tyrosine kinase